YKYITSTTTEKFLEASKKFHRDMWLPRAIEECFLLCEGATYYKGMKANEVSILSFDIETSGLVLDETSKVFLISNTFRSGDKIIRKLFSIDAYPNQREMIIDWCDWVRKVNPSILCGHNILSYDLPYLKHVQQDDLDLGRDGSSAEFSERTSKFR